jgi:P27 family predicted phage terminase small subunit
MPGPAPKPTALKLIQGNPGKRPLNKAEPKPGIDSGYCPRHLRGHAAAEWRRVVPELRRMGLLTVLDRTALEAYCSEYALYRQAATLLEEHGLTFITKKGYVQQRPEVAIAQKALAAMRAFMTQFGMTPASRTKVSARMEEEESDFAKFLKVSGQT